MTASQKRQITLMRQSHVGYAEIANELKLPLSIKMDGRSGLSVAKIKNALPFLGESGLYWTRTSGPHAQSARLPTGQIACFA